MSSDKISEFPKEMKSGSFIRQESSFRNLILKESRFTPSKNRYHLYLCHACPWAHRVVIVLKLKGLEGIITHSFVNPVRDEKGWSFNKSEYLDPINKFKFLSDAYFASDPQYNKRVTVPVMWDKEENIIVNNESSDIIEILNNDFEGFSNGLDLSPKSLEISMKNINDFIYKNINNGVYKCGFSTRQNVYNKEVRKLFTALDQIDLFLDNKDYLFGQNITLSDIRLFVTLIRFDCVYFSHFKTSIKHIYEYKNLWKHTKRLYNNTTIKETVNFKEIKEHYFLTHKNINPTGIIPDTNHIINKLESKELV